MYTERNRELLFSTKVCSEYNESIEIVDSDLYFYTFIDKNIYRVCENILNQHKDNPTRKEIFYFLSNLSVKEQCDIITSICFIYLKLKYIVLDEQEEEELIFYMYNRFSIFKYMFDRMSLKNIF